MNFLRFLIAILLTLLLPIVLLCLAPILIYRWILSVFYPLCSKNILKILHPISATYGTKDERLRVMNNVLVTLDFENELKYEDICAAMQTKILDVNDPDNPNSSLYAEFTHYVVYFAGYYFWKKEDDFKLENHIQMITKIPEPGYQEAFLQEYLNPDQSPWKVLIIETGEVHQILFKFHHTFADGFAILNALTECSSAKSMNLKKQNIMDRRPSWWKLLLFPVIAFYDLLSMPELLSSPWDRSIDQRSRSRVYSAPKSVSKSLIASSAKELNVSLSAILFGAIGSGIHTFLRKEGHEIPKYMTAELPLPGFSAPSRPLENSFSVAQIKIPTSLDNPNAIENAQSELKYIIRSTHPLTRHLILKLVGILPFQSLRFQPRFKSEQMLVSPFPGPPEQVSLNENPVSNIIFKTQLGKCYPLIFSSLRYNGKLSFVIGGDDNVFTQSQINELSDFIHQELLNLSDKNLLQSTENLSSIIICESNNPREDLHR